MNFMLRSGHCRVHKYYTVVFSCIYDLNVTKQRVNTRHQTVDQKMSPNVIVCNRGNHTTCTVNLHGATVISWRVADQEQLFISKKAVLDGKKAIRGGIPIVFPHFGPWQSGPQHGFARITRWKLEKPPETLPNGDIETILTLDASESTRSMWDYSFRLTYRVILRERELQCDIGVHNPSDGESFSFNVLLHTYFKVADVNACQITGLQGCTYVDQTKDGEICNEDRDCVTVTEWTDRIYQNTPDEHQVLNTFSNRKICINKQDLPDTVVWNPWSEKAKEIKDFGDDEFVHMICVEAGCVSTPISLSPGESFRACQTLSLS